MESVIEFSVALRKARKALDMTQDEAAKYIGVSRQTYFGYESGKTKPKTLETRVKIAEFMGIEDVDNYGLLTESESKEYDILVENRELRVACKELHLENARLLEKIEKLETIIENIKRAL